MSKERICGWFGISRQAHSQMEQREQQAALEGEIIVGLVQEIRAKHPRMGVRKLLGKLEGQLQEAQIKIGRDKLYELLRERDLLVRRRRRRVRTTIPGLKHAENLLADTEIVKPNQVWVSDITYLRSEKERFLYLFLVTDAFSRRIMGWHLAPSLQAEGALAALNQAIALADGKVEGLIHHSDRGVQYTCLDYLLQLQEVGARPSMGTTGNCYENALAERVNGTLKVEYCLEDGFVDYAQAWKAVSQVVVLYNDDRPHLALDYLTPTQVYLRHLHSPVAPTQIDSSSAHDPLLPALVEQASKQAGGSRVNNVKACVP